MSTAGSQGATVALPSRVMEVTIKGRVEAFRRHEGKFYTEIRCPAPDAYSSPSTVEVRSDEKLGEKAEDVTVRCRLSGFGRTSTITDRTTGEQKRARFFTHSLVEIV